MPLGQLSAQTIHAWEMHEIVLHAATYHANPDVEAWVAHKAPASPETGLDGWALMMKTEKKDLALVYFEEKAERATVGNLEPNKSYQFTWYDPQSGQW